MRTGALRWSFHPSRIPASSGTRPGRRTPGSTAGAANNWAGHGPRRRSAGWSSCRPGSAAPSTSTAPTGTGDNLFANCAPRAARPTPAKRVWHFQTVTPRHLGPRPARAPSLVTVTRDGRRVDAVAQTTKSGHVFLFERATGSRFSRSSTARCRRRTSRARSRRRRSRFPLKPEPFARQVPDRGDARRGGRQRRTQPALERFRKIRSDGQFVTAEPWKGHARLSRLRRRRGVGRLGLRSRDRRCST